MSIAVPGAGSLSVGTDYSAILSEEVGKRQGVRCRTYFNCLRAYTLSNYSVPDALIEVNSSSG